MRKRLINKKNGRTRILIQGHKVLTKTNQIKRILLFQYDRQEIDVDIIPQKD